MRRDTRFQKNDAIVETYNPYSIDNGYEDDEEEEVAMAEWNQGKKTVMESKRAMISMSQNQTKLFDFLLEKGQIKLLIIMLCCLPIS